jgi:hypothetical protein
VKHDTLASKYEGTKGKQGGALHISVGAPVQVVTVMAKTNFEQRFRRNHATWCGTLMMLRRIWAALPLW